MKKRISKGKFQRVAQMPNTKLYINTIPFANIEFRDHFGRFKYHNSFAIDVITEYRTSLILEHGGFFYYEEWDWQENNYVIVRDGYKPRYTMISLESLKDLIGITEKKVGKDSKSFDFKVGVY